MQLASRVPVALIKDGCFSRDASSALFYFAVLLICGAGIWFILDQGAQLQPATAAAATKVSAEHPAGQGAAMAGPLGALLANLRHPLSLLLLQVLVTTRMRDSAAAAGAPARSRRADEALLVTIKTRKAG